MASAAAVADILPFRPRDDDEAQEYRLARVEGLTHSQAENRVTSIRRRDTKRRLQSRCRDCGHSGLPFRADGRQICRSCHSPRVVVGFRFESIIKEPAVAPPATDPIAARLFEESRVLLIGRERQVIDAITGKDLGPCESCERRCEGSIPIGGCDNYTSRVARWLGVTEAAVAQYRRRAIAKIRTRLASRRHHG